MLRLICLVTLLTVCTFSPALGQETRKDGPDKNQIVTASVTTDGVRISAPSSVAQLRLQVYDDAGQKLLDTKQSGGNVLDWHLQGNAGQRVADSTYLLVVTIKNPGGELSQKLGLVTVTAQTATLRAAGVNELTHQQAQVVGLINGEAESLAVVPAEKAPPVTVLAHTGDQAQVTRSRAALTFRFGDFFGGRDKEQMRLTEDGRLGIGTDNPQATLDVAGTIRAHEGFAFSDGSKLNVNEQGALSLTNSNGSIVPNLAGSGSQNRLAKWIDGIGTLGNSLLSESGPTVIHNGNFLRMTGTPSSSVDSNIIHLDANNKTMGVVAGPGSVFSGNNGPYFILRGNAYSAIAGQRGLAIFSGGNVTSPVGREGSVQFNTLDQIRMLITPAGNVGIGLGLNGIPVHKLHVVDASNSGLRVQTDTPGGTIASFGGLGDFKVDAPGVSGGRVTVKENGNVGIGTNSPTSKLQVAGTVESTAGGFKFPDGSVQTSAAAGKTYTSSSDTELEITRSGANVVALNLPAGIYLLNVTLEFENRANQVFADNTRKLNCYWGNPLGASENAYFRLGGQGSAMDHLPITVHTITNRPVDSSLWFYCYAQYAGDNSYVYIKRRRLTAIKLGDVVTQ